MTGQLTLFLWITLYRRRRRRSSQTTWAENPMSANPRRPSFLVSWHLRALLTRIALTTTDERTDGRRCERQITTPTIVVPVGNDHCFFPFFVFFSRAPLALSSSSSFFAVRPNANPWQSFYYRACECHFTAHHHPRPTALAGMCIVRIDSLPFEYSLTTIQSPCLTTIWS